MNPLFSVFELLNSSSNYAVLRNYEALPQAGGRDIDIIIDRSNFHAVKKQIVKLFINQGYKLWQYYKGGEMHSMVFVEAKSPYNLHIPEHTRSHSGSL